MAENEDTPPGLILPNGEINWNCPCLGGMAVGPCGVEFRDAFSCFHYSTEEPKGKDCLEKFSTMQECMKEYPELFEEKKKDGGEAQEAASDQKTETTETSASGGEESTKSDTKDEEVVEETKSEPVSVSAEKVDIHESSASESS